MWLCGWLIYRPRIGEGKFTQDVEGNNQYACGLDVIKNESIINSFILLLWSSSSLHHYLSMFISSSSRLPLQILQPFNEGLSGFQHGLTLEFAVNSSPLNFAWIHKIFSMQIAILHFSTLDSTAGHYKPTWYIFHKS